MLMYVDCGVLCSCCLFGLFVMVICGYCGCLGLFVMVS